MRYIVFYAPHKAALAEMKAIANELPCDTKPLFLLEFNDEWIQKESENGRVQFHIIGQEDLAVKEKRSVLGSKLIKNKIKRFLDGTVLGCAMQIYVFRTILKNHTLRRLRALYDEISALLQDVDVGKILISNDRSAGVEAVLIRWAMDNNIKVVIPPISYASGPKAAVKIRKDKIYRFKTSEFPFVSIKHPEENNLISFYRLHETLALNEFGVLSSNPWVLGAGKIYKVLVDSEREKERLLALGCRKERIYVTGHMAHDALWRGYRNRECIRQGVTSKYRLSHDKPIVLLSLPQYWEHGLCDKKTHFDIIESLCRTAGKFGNLLVSLHPKMKRKNYNYLERKFGLKVIQESLRDVIVAADIFIATYSSTVAWALLCNLKTIIVDYIGLRYDDFYSEFNIKRVFNEEELSYELSLFQKSAGDVCEIDVNRITRLSPFDGKCSSRIIKCITSC
jgi:hypothetical protein